MTVMHERGYVHQITDIERLDERAAKGPITAYVGYDPTADSLHVGNLVSIMMLRRLQQTGHKPIVIVGGGTAKVGDPSGKDETRQMLTDEKLEHNKQSIKGIFKNYLSLGDGHNDAVMVDNADWLDKLGYISFLRQVGTHFTINRMLTFESVKLRLEREQPLTFLEFNYMIMQAYDFVELYKRYNCILQMGGSDQWGNIVNGVELGRRMTDAELFGLTTPLLTTASGQKMGKTVSGAVWLKAEKLSPYDYWQFWRNTEDADVGRFLKLFTDVPMDEISRLEKLEGAEVNEAKKILATAATTLCHGAEAAQLAAATAADAFAGGSAEGLPTFHLSSAQAVPLVDIVLQLGFAASKGEAKRLLEQGGIRLNDVAVADVQATVGPPDLGPDKKARLSVGKKRHAVIQAR